MRDILGNPDPPWSGLSDGEILICMYHKAGPVDDYLHPGGHISKIRIRGEDNPFGAIARMAALSSSSKRDKTSQHKITYQYNKGKDDETSRKG